MKHRIVLLILLMVSAAWIAAQAPAKTPPPSSDATTAAGLTNAGDVLVIKKNIRYNSGNRADPFIDLEEKKKLESDMVGGAVVVPPPSYEERQRQFPGVRGMLIKELKLQGVVQRSKERVAYFFGPDKRAHFIRVGDKLYNAKVMKITMDTILFEEERIFSNKKTERSLVPVKLHENK